MGCSQQAKVLAYQSFVRPTLDYASPCWDPYRNCEISQIENIQRRAARFVTGIRNNPLVPSSVTSMLHSLKWPSLSTCRKWRRLVILHRISHGSVQALQGLSGKLRRPQSSLRRSDITYCHLQTGTEKRKHSFLPRTIRDWNSLSTEVIGASSTDAFSKAYWKILN